MHKSCHKVFFIFFNYNPNVTYFSESTLISKTNIKNSHIVPTNFKRATIIGDL